MKLIGAGQGQRPCRVEAGRAKIYILGCGDGAGFYLTFLKIGVRDEYGKVWYTRLSQQRELIRLQGQATSWKK